MIEMVWTHPSQAIVIALSILFALFVLIAVGIPLGRNQWQRPMVCLPPPKGPMEKRHTVLIAAAFIIAFSLVWLAIL
jgi:hypothetical protein